MVNQSALECPETITHKSDKTHHNVPAQPEIKAKEYRCVLSNDLHYNGLGSSYVLQIPVTFIS